ncbi:MAG: hypothetical protein KAR11_03830 [Phycisphaerae bacterium]|nr:hypothetical protein [Phycisphaerae bacterium]
MVNREKRKMLANTMMEFMAGTTKAEQFRIAAFKCHDKLDPTLLELSYKAMGDTRSIIDHYITVIKEDWHYWVQMLTFLQTDKNIEKFHHHNPNPQKIKYLTIAIAGIILPLGAYASLCLRSPVLWYLLLIPIMFSILWSMLIAKLFNLKGNYKPNTKIPYYWPYESKEEFESDHEKYAAQLNIPEAPPDLKGKVANVTNFLWVSPRPDE